MWQLTIEPGHGAISGIYENGNTSGMFIEAELTRKLSEMICDELQKSRIRNKLLEYKKPAPAFKDRIKDIDNSSILVSIHFEHYTTKKNKSVIWYSKEPKSLELAQWLDDTLCKWGKQTSENYSGVEIYEGNYPLFDRKGISILISPFCFTSEDALLYAQRLKPLAIYLAHSLASWASRQNRGIRFEEPYSGLKQPLRVSS